MNTGLNPADPTLVAAFRSALLHQGLTALAIIAFLLLLWATIRTWRPGGVVGATMPLEGNDCASHSPEGTPEPGTGEGRARRVLRLGFGVLWVLDGALQAQPKMAGGLASLVIQPAATTSPHWVQHLVNWGGTIWSYHPVQAAAASVWIQAGIGAWLLVSGSGLSSRLAGLASVGWGLVVWVFGEAFGGIFAPGLTFLFGAPGAVLLYVVAGTLIALPERTWAARLDGRLLLGGTGVFLIGMAVLQAWPGRGFWQGGSHGTLSGMISTMTATPQPHMLSMIISGAATYTTAHGWAVNLFAVIALAGMGAAFVSGQHALVRYAFAFGLVFLLADWLLVEDLGFMGGLGTDPNSMIPMVLLMVAGYLALSPQPAQAAEAAEAAEAAPEPAAEPRKRSTRGIRELATIPAIAALSAIAVIAIGAAPMAAAAADRNADPILAEAVAGDTAVLSVPAPAFTLTDQNGRAVELASLRGKVVLLTFLDPVCTTDCPIIGAEFRQAAALLGDDAKNVVLVGVVANPTYLSAAETRAYDREVGLDKLPNWLFLTGSLTDLRPVWTHYDITVQNLPAGAMAAHNDLAFVITKNGTIRTELNTDPGPGTSATRSSFAVLLARYARQALASR